MGIYAHDTWHNGGGGYVGTYSNHNVTFVQNATSAGYIDTSKNLIWQGSSVRAPLFYDSNNTGYYTDPAGTSLLNTLGIGISPASKLHVHGTQSYGSLRISPTSTNGESAMAFYSDTAGVQTSNAWVVGHAGWGHTGDFIIGNQAGGGPLILVQQDGKTGIGNITPSERLTVTGNILATSSVRAPIFYDSNNTGYYVDPASGTNLNGTLVNNGGTGMTGGWNRNLLLNSTFPVIVFNSNSTKYSGIGVDYSVSEGGMKFWVGGNSSNITDGSASLVLKLDTGNFVTANGSSRAPLFYDSNNTGYYVDPASTGISANFNGRIQVGKFSPSQSNSGEAWIGRATDRVQGTLSVQLGTGSGRKFEVVDAGWTTVEFSADDSGNATAASSMRAPVFYDSNNTGYYIDPAGLSNIRTIKVAGAANTTFATPNIQSYGSSNSGGVANYHLKFMAQNGNSNGSISTNYYQTTYATTSDYRVKEDLQPMLNATSRLMSLNPVNFQWKDSDMRTDGFLAHEVAEVVTDAVVGEKDAVDEQGNDELQALDQSKLVPLLVKTIQEQQGVIEALEARISALEA